MAGAEVGTWAYQLAPAVYGGGRRTWLLSTRRRNRPLVFVVGSKQPSGVTAGGSVEYRVLVTAVCHA